MECEQFKNPLDRITLHQATGANGIVKCGFYANTFP